MPRGLDAATKAASAAERVRPVYFFFGDFQSQVLRVNSTDREITWDDQTWLGVGRLGAIEQVSEGVELKAYGLSLRLSGIPADHIARALGDRYQGRTGILYVALGDPAWGLVGPARVLYRGRMDQMLPTVSDDGSVSIVLTLENRLADWNRARVRRITNEDQQSRFAGDLGLEFVPQMADKTLIWGRG